MATLIAAMVLGEYSANMALNENGIPSPFWAGFWICHIEKDLARGLLYDGKKLGLRNGNTGAPCRGKARA
jgi:hypothetical protein